MRVAQYINSEFKSSDNKSFQREVWDKIWSKNSFDQLLTQLDSNPLYWQLKKKINKKDKILEAGCGFSQWVYKLSSLGYDITGVDNAENTVKLIKKKFPKLKIKLADVEKLPFKNQSFNVYLSFGVVEHFEQGPEKVLKEANRVLKKDGLLYLTIPYLNLYRRINSLTRKKEGNFYQYLYTKEDIGKRIEKAGFKIINIEKYDFINALMRDFPTMYKVLHKLMSFKHTSFKTEQEPLKNFKLESYEPSFRLQKLLYNLDSYILLIEARKK